MSRPSIEPPQRPQRERESSIPSWLSIVLAGLAAILIGVLLFYLTLGFFAIALLIVGGLAMAVGFHYLVWGRWLGPLIRAEVEAEEAEEARAHHDDNGG